MPKHFNHKEGPNLTKGLLFIVLPVNHHKFNLEPGTIQLLPTFHGMDSENPYTHMKEFEEVCGTCMEQMINEDVV